VFKVAAVSLSLLLVSTVALAQTAERLATLEEGAASEQLAQDLSETVMRLPVTVQPLFGDPRSGEMIMSHFKPMGNGPFPAVIMHHGRSASDEERAKPARWRYLDVVRYWTSRGVAVFIPTRLGYGDTGISPDPEFTGPCNAKRYDVAADAVAIQSLAAIEFAIKQPWVNPAKVIVMGQSMGGFTTIVTMGKKHPSVIAGINFAGGGGGDPKTRPSNPCDFSRLGRVFAEAGKLNAGSIPMLWLYSENDNYWGPTIPGKWHEAYVGAGGKSELKMFGPVGNEGHLLISQGRAMWRPVLDAFLAQFGINPPKAADAPSASNFAELADASKLPLVREDVKTIGYKRFLNLDLPRAFAIGPRGEFAFRSGVDAVKGVLERCSQTAKVACKLYAVDDAVVWVP
jgi:dienelactone hydrolase